MEAIVKIEVTQLDIIKNLVELLQRNFDELPKEVQEVLINLEESGLNDIGVDEAVLLYGVYEKYENSYTDHAVISINKALKKVKYWDGEKEGVAYPEHFWHSFDGRKVEEW